MTPYQKFMQGFGATIWLAGLFGAVWAIFGDEFLGRDYNDWMILALVGWCSYLQSMISRAKFVIKVDR